MNEIENIRYDGLKIAWDYRGKTFLIDDPLDVMLVSPYVAAARKWIWQNYGYLLGVL